MVLLKNRSSPSETLPRVCNLPSLSRCSSPFLELKPVERAEQQIFHNGLITRWMIARAALMSVWSRAERLEWDSCGRGGSMTLIRHRLSHKHIRQCRVAIFSSSPVVPVIMHRCKLAYYQSRKPFRDYTPLFAIPLFPLRARAWSREAQAGPPPEGANVGEKENWKQQKCLRCFVLTFYNIL